MRETAVLSLGAALVMAGAAPAARAQAVRVHLVDERSGADLSGALITVVGERGTRVAESLANSDGRRVLPVTGGASYRVLVRRIGYRPFTSAPVAVAGTDTVTVTLRVPANRVVLSEVVVRAARQCSAVGSDESELSLVWGAIETALAASEVTQAEQLAPVEGRTFQRDLDEGERVLVADTTSFVRTSHRPFVALAPAELSAKGYVMRSDGRKLLDTPPRDDNYSVSFYAPDARVLISDEFLREHCFHAVAGAGDHAEQIGLAFEPIRSRDLPDVKGILWVDRRSAELRTLQFEYVNAAIPRWSADVGGRIRFERLPTGAWIVSAWQIRMPMRRATSDGSRGIGYREEGGEARIARAEPRPLRLVPVAPTTLGGAIYDSTRRAPLGGAVVSLATTDVAVATDSLGRFTIATPLAGRYTLVVEHPWLDHLGIVSRTPIAVTTGGHFAVSVDVPSVATIIADNCRGRADTTSGLVTGVVRDRATGNPIVHAALTFALSRPNASRSAPPAGSLQAESDDAGRFRLCDAPAGATVTIRGVADSGRSGVAVARAVAGQIVVQHLELTGRDRHAAAALRLAVPRSGEAVASRATEPALSGRVIDHGVPVPLAIVVVGDRSTTADDSGHFRLAVSRDARALVEVRRSGRRPARFFADLGSDSALAVVIRLALLPDEPGGTSRDSSLEREGFYARRRGVGGWFLSPAEVESRHATSFTQLLYGIRGVRVMTVTGTRPVGGFPTGADGCLLALFLDGRRIDWRAPVGSDSVARDGSPPPLTGDGFDAAVPVLRVRAIEVYAAPGSAPEPFAADRCGSVVVWTAHD